MIRNPELTKRITSLRAKALLAIASGEDLTKLQIKQSTALSMSSVISAVDALVSEGLVSLDRERSERGGKPHSVINLRKENLVYGVSYLSGALTVAEVGLKGDLREVFALDLQEGETPESALCRLAELLATREGRPRALALALNCEGKERLVRSLEEKLSVPVLPTTNTSALAYLAYWRGGSLPICVIGMGRGVKCACLDEKGCRAAELGSLRAAPAFSEEGDYRALLSAARVEESLRKADYRGHYLVEGGRLFETQTLGEYSRALALSIASLSDWVDALCTPREIYLFGEYLSGGFFDRIKDYAAAGDKLVLLRAEREDFACGAATAALIERVFS